MEMQFKRGIISSQGHKKCAKPKTWSATAAGWRGTRKHRQEGAARWPICGGLKKLQVPTRLWKTVERHSISRKDRLAVPSEAELPGKGVGVEMLFYGGGCENRPENKPRAQQTTTAGKVKTTFSSREEKVEEKNIYIKKTFFSFLVWLALWWKLHFSRRPQNWPNMLSFFFF